MDTELLFKLSRALGPSGNEKNVREIILREVKKHISDCTVDKFGNLICHRKGKGAKVMLAAHMDEIGLMVRRMGDLGKIFISTIGGIEPVSLVGQQVDIIIKEGLIRGIVTFEELQDGDIVDFLPKLDDFYVDTGLSKEGLDAAGLRIGDYIVPTHTPGFLGNQRVISGKAMDDRVGCAIMIELIKRLSKIKTDLDLFFVFTVQEEVGLYGAKTATWNINPDWGIAVDTTSAEDSVKEQQTRVLGKGPIITIKDVEVITNKCLNEHLFELARKNKIPYQRKVEEGGSFDATNMMLQRGGVPCSVVAVPIRNIHSTIGIAHLDDIENAVKLLELLLKTPPKMCGV